MGGVGKRGSRIGLKRRLNYVSVGIHAVANSF